MESRASSAQSLMSSSRAALTATIQARDAVVHALRRCIGGERKGLEKCQEAITVCCHVGSATALSRGTPTGVRAGLRWACSLTRAANCSRRNAKRTCTRRQQCKSCFVITLLPFPIWRTVPHRTSCRPFPPPATSLAPPPRRQKAAFPVLQKCALPLPARWQERRPSPRLSVPASPDTIRRPLIGGWLKTPCVPSRGGMQDWKPRRPNKMRNERAAGAAVRQKMTPAPALHRDTRNPASGLGTGQATEDSSGLEV